MEVSRRTFLGLAAAGGAMCACGDAEGEFDENLTVIVTDIHVGGEQTGVAEVPFLTEKLTPHPRRRLKQFVDEVLAMRPRPRRVVSLGDLAFLRGLSGDYAVAKPLLQPLFDAGIEVVFCMGNHDRRSEMEKAWPGEMAKSPVPGRFVRVVSLGTADLVTLDGLQGTDDRPLTEMGPGSGRLSEDQMKWMVATLPNMKRPFFLASHFPDEELSVCEDGKWSDLATWLLRRAPMCRGYLYGHLHIWRPGWKWLDLNHGTSLRVVSLPSCGMWGDIGYVTFRTHADRAVCELHQDDFFFPCEPDSAARPAPWRCKVEENRGARVVFPYERGGV